MATTRTRGIMAIPDAVSEFPFRSKTRAGSEAIIFAYAQGQARPWLGAYLVGGEYVPMSWLGNGKFIADYNRASDVPELEHREKKFGKT